MDTPNLINAFTGLQGYAAFFQALSNTTPVQIDLEGRSVSEALYYHTCRMHHIGWRHRVDFRRGQKHASADIFQDLVAFHLRMCLPSGYTLHLEEKRGRVRPDILIRRDGIVLWCVEVKTSIGWARPNEKDPEPFAEFQKRVDALRTTFELPVENVLYVFETHSNVSASFSEQFWYKMTAQPKSRPTSFPHNIIYPLFNDPDPYYWKGTWPNGEREVNCFDLEDRVVLERAAASIVSPLETVAKRIMAMRHS